MARKYGIQEVASARLRFTRIPPRKARFVVDLIRGRKVGEAFALIAHLYRPSASPQIARLLKAAVAGVDKAAHPDPDDLYIAGAWVDVGPTLKRWQPRARGMASPIRKRTCHVTLVLSDQAAG
jgi:large subunit ribosomal protein L22